MARKYSNGRVGWARVYKNASTSILQAVSEAGWKQGRPYEWCFAVVRHPVDRWWSGIHQYHLNNRIPHEQLLAEARQGKFVFDQHTQPQVDQIPDGAVLVPFENVEEFCAGIGLKLPHIRRRDVRVEAADLIPAILDYYAEDLLLYESARS